jgi:hypothetical protein
MDGRAFLRKNNLEDHGVGDFVLVIERVREFLEFPLNAMTIQGLQRDRLNWQPRQRRWGN